MLARAMKVMAFSSAVVIVLNYVRPFSQLGHQITITPLVPSAQSALYEGLITQANARALESGGQVKIYPIFLSASDSRFATLLNPTALFRDFAKILRVIWRVRPEAIICFYLPDAFPLVALRRFFSYLLAVVAMGTDVNLEKRFLRSWMRKLICRQSDLLFARSAELKDKLKRESGRDAVLFPSARASRESLSGLGQEKD
jgi:hypothetical protein